MNTGYQLSFDVGGHNITAFLLEPADADVLFVYSHGAGAGWKHPLMAVSAEALARHRVATLRFHFPYLEEGRRRPDPPRTLEATIRRAVEVAYELRPGLPIVAGGRSMGGRMTTLAQAEEPIAGVKALVLLAFPLHPARKPSMQRAKHLDTIEIPMLFVNGDRDALARIDLLRRVCRRLGDRATLHVVADADHSFKVTKRSGRTAGEVQHEIALAVRRFCQLEVLHSD